MKYAASPRYSDITSVTPSGEQTVAGNPILKKSKSMTTAPSGGQRFVQAAFVQIKWKELDKGIKKEHI